MGPKFERLQRVLAAAEPLRLAEDPTSIAPERAIVFEVVGPVQDFYQEAKSIGLEYLADDEAEFAPSDGFSVKNKPEQLLEGRVYMAMPDLRALGELVGLWRHFTAGGRMKNGFGMWTGLFKLLKNVRPWGPSDRVLPETLEYWRTELAERPEAPVRSEVELWFRSNPAIRAAKAAALQEYIAALGGRTIHAAAIPEIRYHALLVELPAARVREMLEHPDVQLARVDDIMFIRPQSMVDLVEEADRGDDPGGELTAASEVGAPIAALLDGLPVENHARLRDRLTVDDPEDVAPTYTVRLRSHGTEMASLILHGDINDGEEPLGRRLYVRPILRPTAHGEGVPPDRLLVDLLYTAVRRIKVGDGDAGPVAPQVVLINLSLGDRSRPFAGPMSPLARLLDYLSYRHRVLFLVSAGNVRTALPLPDFDGWTAFEEADADARELAVLSALHGSKRHRTLLSPAESLNSLSIGAAHKDSVAQRARPWQLMDPFTSEDLPNVSSALGLGHRRIVKPDILMSGGREPVQMLSTNPHLHVIPARATQGAFGLLAAAPDSVGASLTKTALTFGTSAATALATRAAHKIIDAVTAADGPIPDLPVDYQGVMAKALLVHGASWGDKSELLEEVCGPADPRKHNERKDNVTRYLGYGAVDVARTVECARNRATLLGWGTVAAGGAKLYRIPLPPGLDGATDFRSLTVTVAWFAPVDPRHQGYRMASLDVDPGGDPNYSLAVNRATAQPHFHAVKRGSVIQDRRDGARAAAYVDDGNLLVRISCRSASAAFENEVIPYAFALTVEVGVESNIEVYSEIRAAIEVRARAAVALANQ